MIRWGGFVLAHSRGKDLADCMRLACAAGTATAKTPGTEPPTTLPKTKSEAVTYAVCVLADHLDATAIVAPTQSGRTAIHISKFRPKQPIIAFTPSQTTLRQLSFPWDIPRMILNHRDMDDLIEKASKRAVETGNLIEGDLAVITAGNPVWVAGMTNMVRVMPLLDRVILSTSN